MLKCFKSQFPLLSRLTNNQTGSLGRQEQVRLDYRVLRTATWNLVEIVYLSDYRWERMSRNG